MTTISNDMCWKMLVWIWRNCTETWRRNSLGFLPGFFYSYSWLAGTKSVVFHCRHMIWCIELNSLLLISIFTWVWGLSHSPPDWVPPRLDIIVLLTHLLHSTVGWEGEITSGSEWAGMISLIGRMCCRGLRFAPQSNIRELQLHGELNIVH